LTETVTTAGNRTGTSFFTHVANFCTTKLERQNPRVNRTIVRDAGVGIEQKLVIADLY